ncbi:MAG: BACON domain-containing protein [Bacteroides sp.]|nr:BACON domain-containing protein [Bacteroides sp.]
MKHLLKIALGIMVVAGCITACNDTDEISGFSIDKEQITIGAAGGTDKVTVTSASEWVAIASEPWLMVSPANGIGVSECKIVIDSTLVNDVRTATIRFTPDGQEVRTVTVNQTGFEKTISLQETEMEIEALAGKNERYFEATVTTNIPFKVNIEYKNGDIEWLSNSTTNVDLDRGARPRTVKIRFDWRMNIIPETRVAKINFVPTKTEDVLPTPVVLTLTQKAAAKIEDNRAGDSLALLMIQEQMNMLGSAWDASENLRNWDDVVLWEATDTDLPCKEAVGRVREVTFFMFNTEESIPQEIRYLKYLESLYFGSNVNTMLKSIDLGSEICELDYLKNLQIFSYGLVSLPDDFYKLGNSLENLDLTANNFTAIPKVLTKENFPKLKVLKMINTRRWTTSDLRKADSYENGIGLHFNTRTDNSLRKLFLWDTLEELSLSNCYIEGELPDFEVGVDGIEAYTQADVDAFGGDTIQYLADHRIPKVLPNMKMLRLNLNFFTGNIPDWVLYHPHFLDWIPELLFFIQKEQGINSDGKVVRFDNEPVSFDYYYNALPGTREKYELQEEISD